MTPTTHADLMAATDGFIRAINASADALIARHETWTMEDIAHYNWLQTQRVATLEARAKLMDMKV